MHDRELETHGVERGQKWARAKWYAKSPFTQEREGDLIEIEEIVQYTLSGHDTQGVRIAHARVKCLSGFRQGDGEQIACRAIRDNWRLVE